VNEKQKTYTREQIRAAFQFWFEDIDAHPDEHGSWDGIESNEQVEIATNYLVGIMETGRA